ncbi:hypothetical protein OGAPHI_005414 [Ogataea philodendri]|uniref:Allantoate permease n=1 Tax=Ogataea philodendri TaxID=1378263 RepID=A0A9P8T1Y6_9ASCO|nr:uncharacterized protein OGAPHI_005414 [Ogataea philodendri]KAH3662166.1 hypothetical protein OGAPHI_005414 [Ogataea philodendri]
MSKELSPKESISNVQMDIEDSAEALAAELRLNKRVVMKIDLVILPFLVCTVFLQLLDKNCLSYAALYGLKTDNNLKGQEYSWLATIFYIGYLFAEIPVFFLLPKIKNLCRWMCALLVIWGALLMCMAGCHNFAGLATVRLFLGIFEAAIQPACIILSTTWYTKSEQPIRMALWSNTFAGVFNGIFGYGIGHWTGSLSTWKYFFLVYGAVTIAFGIVCSFLLPNSIETAWFLNAEEKKCAIARTATNQTGIHLGAKDIKWKQILEAVTDPKYWLLVVFIIVQNFINAGITNFNTFIIKGFGYSNYRTMLLATPQAAVAMGACISVAFICYFVKNIRYILICLTTCVTMAGIIMLWKVSPTLHRNTCLAAVYICGFYNAPYVLTLSLIASNNSGSTKKAFNSISVGLFYALGNLIGPQFFLNSESPTYPTGIKAMLAACVIMLFCVSVYALLCFVENRRRDKTQLVKNGELDLEEIIRIGKEVDRDDLTDVQNKYFRYSF